MTETRTPYNTGNDRPLEIIRQDDTCIIVKLGDMLIAKEVDPQTGQIDPALLHITTKEAALLRYITVARTEQLVANIRQAVAIAGRLDSLVRTRADFERVTVEDLVGVVDTHD